MPYETKWNKYVTCIVNFITSNNWKNINVSSQNIGSKSIHAIRSVWFCSSLETPISNRKIRTDPNNKINETSTRNMAQGQHRRNRFCFFPTLTVTVFERQLTPSDKKQEPCQQLKNGYGCWAQKLLWIRKKHGKKAQWMEVFKHLLCHLICILAYLATITNTWTVKLAFTAKLVKV